jgi:probable HAF family extracellular repeat protein
MKFLWTILLACVVALAVSGAGAASTAATYTTTDLGSFGLGVTDGYAVNANGQVAGGSYLSSAYQITCPANYPNPKKCVRHPEHAFLYSGGQLSDLGTLNGGKNSQGKAINLSGQVAGWSDTSNGYDAVLWNAKKATDLGVLAPIAGQDSVAAGINDSGQVVGTWGTNNPEHAFLYSGGAVTTLPAPTFVGSFGCQGNAINNKARSRASVGTRLTPPTWCCGPAARSATSALLRPEPLRSRRPFPSTRAVRSPATSAAATGSCTRTAS